MRTRSWSILALALLAGCKISELRFSVDGVDAGDGNPDSMSTTDGPADAPPAATKGFIVDDNTVIRVSRDINGDLEVLGSQSVIGAQFPLVNPQGTRLFIATGGVGANNAIAQYSIAADGTLQFVSQTQIPCTPTQLALHPQGSAVAFGCSVGSNQGSGGVIPLSSAGELLSMVFPVGASERRMTPTFSRTGRCLFWASPTTSGGSGSILTAIYEGGLLTDQTTTNTGFVGVALASHGDLLYAVGNGVVRTFSILENSCAATQMSTVSYAETVVNHVAVSPTGDRLYVAGIDVWVSPLQAGTPTSVTRAQSVGRSVRHLLPDPVQADLVYITEAISSRPATYSSTSGLFTLGAPVTTTNAKALALGR